MLFKMFSDWLIERSKKSMSTEMIGKDGQVVAKRYMPFFMDEWARYKLPWWCPVNGLVHHWGPIIETTMHDHPRWSITIVLRGEMKEVTPWGSHVLRPGNIVIRSRKYIHLFEVEDEAWTLFIVGRRLYPQNRYQVTPFPEQDDYPVLKPRKNKC